MMRCLSDPPSTLPPSIVTRSKVRVEAGGHSEVVRELGGEKRRRQEERQDYFYHPPSYRNPSLAPGRRAEAVRAASRGKGGGGGRCYRVGEESTMQSLLSPPKKAPLDPADSGAFARARVCNKSVLV